MIVKLTLKELMEFEEKLLLIDAKYKVENDEISFGDYVMVQQNLDNIGKITNYYFNILEKHKSSKNQSTQTNINQMIYCDVNYNEDDYKQIKYLIENFPCD